MAKTISVVRRAYQLATGATVVALAAADPYSEELIGELFDGEEYTAELKQNRRRGELNLYWAGIGLLVKNYSGPSPAIINIGKRAVDASRMWPTSDYYHEMMMEATGHVTRLWRLDGTFRVNVDSIALKNMDQADFSAYFEHAKAITFGLFGYDPWETWKEESNRRRVAKFRRTES